MPYDLNSASAIGGGPHDTVKTGWYFYLEQKPNTKAKWATALGGLPHMTSAEKGEGVSRKVNRQTVV